MIKIRMIMGCLVTIGAFSAFAAPAVAEFESLNSESKGSGEIDEATLEGGGATVTCQALEAGTSKAGWTVTNAGKAQVKGSGLLVKVASWGTCQTKATGLKEAETKVGECELEIQSSQEQTKAPMSIAKTCTMKVSTCELVIEAIKANKELKEVSLMDSEVDPGLDLGFAVKGITVSASGTSCPIEKTSTAKLQGVGQMNNVQVPAPREFALMAPSSATGTQTFNVKVKRIGGANGTLPPGVIGVQEPPDRTGQFMIETGFVNCTTNFNYILNGADCEFTMKYNKAIGLGFALIQIAGRNGVRTAVIVQGD